MAKLGEIQSGFTFHEQPASKPKKSRREARVRTCRYCGGETKRLSKLERAELDFEVEDGDQFTCRHCLGITGYGFKTGVTHEGSFDRIAQARETEWVMILRVPPLCAPDGRRISLDMGDVIKISRIGGPEAQEGQPISAAHSKACWTIDVQLGPVTVTLWPHEFSPISFTEVMALRSEGQLYEQFVGADDDVGYFAPVPEMRAQIDACFGA